MPSTPPPQNDSQQQSQPQHPPPEESPATSEPLAKRVKPNPGISLETAEKPGRAVSPRASPPTVLPFDPAHPAAMASSSDRPSLPSMAALMSPDPNSSTLPAPPPNTAAFPPSAGGGGAGGPPPMGLGFVGGAPVAPPVGPLQIKLLSSDAKAPSRGSAFAAGYDIYAAEATSVPKQGRKLVSTGIACAVPTGTYARIAPRSGLAVKHGIATGAGVVDEDYRGEVKVLLFNHSDEDFAIAVGDRIAQMVLERIVTPEVATVETLEESVRGAGGFGSTGGFGGMGMGIGGGGGLGASAGAGAAGGGP